VLDEYAALMRVYVTSNSLMVLYTATWTMDIFVVITRCGSNCFFCGGIVYALPCSNNFPVFSISTWIGVPGKRSYTISYMEPRRERPYIFPSMYIIKKGLSFKTKGEVEFMGR
jgi:hypothetical protein